MAACEERKSGWFCFAIWKDEAKTGSAPPVSLKRTTPSGAAVVATLLEPVTAVLIAVLFLGERLTVAGVVGALLIGVAIGSLGRRERPAPQ